MRLWSAGLAPLLFLSLINTPSSRAQVIVGTVRPYQLESVHPYPAGDDNHPVVATQRIVFPGAKFLRLHFTAVSLALGDSLTISTADGSQTLTYTNRGPDNDGEFWTFALPGESVEVALHAGPYPGYGYRIVEVGVGDVDLSSLTERGEQAGGGPAEATKCPDFTENVVCHKDDELFWNAQKPVAYLLFKQAGSDRMASCTGWLIEGTKKDTLITNRHCISDKSQLKSLQASFNLQTSKCEGDPDAPHPTLYGAKFPDDGGFFWVSKKDDLDYSLMQLKDSPEEKWGAITPLGRDPEPKDEIEIPQQPNGLKVVGWYQFDDKKTRCLVGKVFGVISEFTVQCFLKSGSSGSPVLTPSGRAVGLARAGSKIPGDCTRLANTMSAICKDAGGENGYLDCGNP